MHKRTLTLPNLLKQKSFFLFGPRSTGKTTLIEAQLAEAKVYDLLDAEVYARLLREPKLIEQEIDEQTEIVVIDEVQKMPSLLDEVQRLIHKRVIRFLLTGSSARKLKRQGVNMLGGRAWLAALFPLTSNEIKGFDLLRYLQRGGLPHIYDSELYREELRAYVSVYLREEIQLEAVTRNVRAFAEFLDIIAMSNGFEINYEGLASDLQVSASTVRSYFDILDDTLIGYRLPGYIKTKMRKAISRSKYYLFDIGVVNTLSNRTIESKSESFGDAFEHFIINEIRAFLSYSRSELELTYWRSTSQFEVDLVIGDEAAIEIKATKLVHDRHLKGIRALKEEGLIRAFYVVSQDPEARRLDDGVIIIPWQRFLKQMWAGELF